MFLALWKPGDLKLHFGDATHWCILCAVFSLTLILFPSYLFIGLPHNLRLFLALSVYLSHQWHKFWCQMIWVLVISKPPVVYILWHITYFSFYLSFFIYKLKIPFRICAKEKKIVYTELFKDQPYREWWII